MIYPVFLSGFKGGEVRNKKKGSSPSLKSRYRQGIPFLTQVFPELEKSLRTGDIISCLGYPLPEGEIRDIEMVGLQQIAKRHVCYSVKKRV